MLSLPVSITTKIRLFSVNKNPYKPSFATVTGSIQIYGNTTEVHQIPKINGLPFWLRIDQPLSSQTFSFAQPSTSKSKKNVKSSKELVHETIIRSPGPSDKYITNSSFLSG